MSDYGWNERRRAAEEQLLQKLGGFNRVDSVLRRLLAPVAGVRKAELREDLQGVDYWADRSGARSLGVDVKCRESDWPDLLVEFVSNSETGAPGWTVNPSNITDFVLYLMPQSEVLVPYPQLRAAASSHVDDWIVRFGESGNRTTTDGGRYRTRWVAVPDAVVADAIGFRIVPTTHGTWTTAEPVGPRCGKCGGPPIATESAGWIDTDFVRFCCAHGHRWEGRAA